MKGPQLTFQKDLLWIRITRIHSIHLPEYLSMLKMLHRQVWKYSTSQEGSFKPYSTKINLEVEILLFGMAPILEELASRLVSMSIALALGRRRHLELWLS